MSLQEVADWLVSNAIEAKPPVYMRRYRTPLGPCLLTMVCKLPTGYGKVSFNGKVCLAHRIVYEAVYGYVPYLLRHKCDEPACINYKHLLPGDDYDNAMDRENRGRGNHWKGEQVNTAKLTAGDVLAIRKDYEVGGITYKELAERYGVQWSAIGKIVTRTSWRHLD